MRKSILILRKLIIVFSILLAVNVMIFFSSTPISASTNDDIIINNKNGILLYENFMLRKKYVELEKKLIDIENNLISINNYDNYIYYQTLGIDIDTNCLNIKSFNLYTNLDTISVDSIFNYLDKRMLTLSCIMANQLEKMLSTSEEIKNNKELLNNYPTISPIKTIDLIQISSGFGWRMHPIYHTQLFHDGVDINASKGTKVYSSMKGIVEKITYSKYGYGNKIVIKNSSGFETLYAHLSSIIIKKGQIVQKGDYIGTVGNTGLATGDHLHYEIHQNNELKDPLSYFYTYLTTESILLAKNDHKN
jgi:hypothetical protein